MSWVQQNQRNGRKIGTVFDQGMVATQLKVRHHANHFFTILYQGADTGPAAIGLRYHLQDVGKIFDGYELIWINECMLWGPVILKFWNITFSHLKANLLVLDRCGVVRAEKLPFKACSI